MSASTGDDEAQIRALLATWMDATRAGDADTVLSLMTDDVVFLVPGGVMRKPDFAAAAKSWSGPGAAAIDGRSEILELEIVGDHAFLWTRLEVSLTPPGGAAQRRRGHTLTILRKEDGRWLLARDANLLVPDSR